MAGWLARPGTVVAVALAAMTALRLLHFQQLSVNSVFFDLPMVDALEYLLEARARAAGTYEYRVPAHGPLYPILLGWAYAACAGDAFWLHVLSSLAGPATVLVLFFGGRRLLGAWPAAGAAVCFAFYRPGLLYECEYYAAGLANLTVTLAAVLLMHTVQRPGWRGILALGATLGAASITRGNLLMLTPVAVVVLALSRAPWSRIAVLVLIALAPGTWFTYQNYQVSGAWIPIQGRTGQNLAMANHPDSDGTVDIRPGPVFESLRRRPMTHANAWGPAAESRFYWEEFTEFVRGQPGRFAALLWTKAWNSLSPVEAASSYDNESNTALSWVLRIPLPGFAWLLPLVLVGLVRPAASRRSHLALVAMCATIWVGLILVFPTGRYRYQAAGMLCLLAAIGGRAIVECWRTRERRATLLTGGALAVGLIVNACAPRFERQAVRWRAEFQQLRAYPYLLGKRMVPAREWAAAAVRLDPDYAWPRYTLGVLAMHGSDGKPYTLGARFDAAIEYFTAAIERWPDFPDAYQNRAIAHLRLGDARAAVRDFLKTVELVPYRYQAWDYLAQAYALAGQSTEASTCRSRAVRERELLRQRTGAPR